MSSWKSASLPGEVSREDYNPDPSPTARAAAPETRDFSPLIDICNKLVRFDLAPVPEETRIYFRDAYDDVMRVNEMVDNLREMLNSDLEANFADLHD